MRVLALICFLFMTVSCAQRGLPEELDGSSSDVTETESGADETDSGDGASEEETEAPEADEPTGEDLEGEIPGDNDETIESEIDDGGEPSDGADDGESGSDGAETGSDGSDPSAEPGPEPEPEPEPIDPACDLDFDGEASEACGGTDCDDTRGDVGTGSAEICDFVDNNCNTEVNELLDCAVYAVSDNELLKIDPFFATVDVVAQTPRTYFDIDTDSSGRLFAISGGSLTGGLYEYDASDDAWSLIGRINPEFESPNGLAITDDGQLLATGMEHLYVLSPTSGFASTIDSYRNASGEGIVSSGDCVVSKENGVFMTSSVAGSNSDQLVRLTPSSAVGEVIGDIGFGRVWGLSSIGGRLFGFTHQTVNSGSVVMIDGETGEGTFLFDIPYGIYGAASRAER